MAIILRGPDGNIPVPNRPDSAPKSSSKEMKGSNATLSYKVSGHNHTFKLWVMEIEQPHMLSGQPYQSRTKRHFYPRSYAPGDIAVSGRCTSQENYQRLSLFIRKHQRAVLNVPATERFARVNTSAPGYQRLMRLSIPSEQLLVRGWIDNFSFTKSGVFAPAPEFKFSFFVVFDNTARDIGISHRIKKYYERGDIAAARTRRVAEDLAGDGNPFDDPPATTTAPKPVAKIPIQLRRIE
ncbi:MAG: hypothetical protein H0X02_11335 [Nitrosomonas sp.]|nr:hypothetical protein [Nitrosomonas sp.]